MRPWFDLFEASREVVIEDMEHIREDYPELYALLKRQDIWRLFVVPLHSNGVLGGFIGVDNPRIPEQDFSLLQSLAYFVDIEIAKRRTAIPM